ncbi:DUF927 domain-containing protein [Neorhizobium sp. S3-V5DH]|uniref:DUF927 domain-containing protein n=1 Tax=Neorhizobium sp. S3-V5DH TaxID=2485166 RepID=UPI001046C252|nr:DUF927 domain-containing protein [Neorhizobium sp. S3-V5DH]TCV75919.1 uncharacterized protein DUF927 [Neorhizobium sp. S3-V5DH]
MTKRLVIEMRSGAVVEGSSQRHMTVRAKAGNDTAVTVWLLNKHATNAGIVADELVQAGLNTFETDRIKQAHKAAVKNVIFNPATVVSKSGWHGRDFVFDGRVFRTGEISSFRLHQNLRETHVPYPSKKNDDLIDFIDDAASQSDLLAAAVMIAFAQPLLGLAQPPERPVVYIWGDSTTGKTSLGSLMNAITRPPADRELQSFDSTQRAFEEKLKYYSDNVAVFDELSSLDDAALEKAFSTFIYMAANGRGKNRSEGSNFPNLRWRTTAVITGEKDPDTINARRKRTGQDARLLILPVPSRDEGGIWPSSMTLDERVAMLTKLDALIATYSGHSYLNWIRWVVAKQDEVKIRYAESVSSYARQMAGEGGDSLDRRSAVKFAQLAAAGDEIIRAGIVAWDDELPFEVLNRLYQADRSAKQQSGRGGKTAQQHAISILARCGAGTIPVANRKDAISSMPAFVKTWDGQPWVMIRKGEVERFAGAPEALVMEALCTTGISVAHGSTPYFQDRRLNKRFLRVSVADLARLAFGDRA